MWIVLTAAGAIPFLDKHDLLLLISPHSCKGLTLKADGQGNIATWRGKSAMEGDRDKKGHLKAEDVSLP